MRGCPCVDGLPDPCTVCGAPADGVCGLDGGNPAIIAELLDIIELLVEPEDGPDLGTCPYFLKDGSEGAYGPNTCAFGCSQEPECQTCCPSDGWPSARARDVLARMRPEGES